MPPSALRPCEPTSNSLEHGSSLHVLINEVENQHMGQADTTKRFRHAARAIILDAHNDVLLCRFQIPHPAVPAGVVGVWTAPGGGIEPGELPLEALRRELLEETGLTVDTDPPHVWRQEVVAGGHGDGKDGFLNDYFLVRTARFNPRGILSSADIAAEGISEMRWWALSDIAAHQGTDLFSPRDLATLLTALVGGSVPSPPLALGL